MAPASRLVPIAHMVVSNEVKSFLDIDAFGPFVFFMLFSFILVVFTFI